jgi:DNA polymerase III epsilon subunit-like protein
MTHRDTFLRSVTVLDTETTNLYPDKAEIVEIAGASYDGQNWQVESRLFGAADGIPPEASAKNHISMRMIEGKPTFIEQLDEAKRIMGLMTSTFFVAHNCAYDQTVLDKAFVAAGDHGAATLAIGQNWWICTHRLSKKLLDVNFDDMEYNLSFLRYKLDLPVDDDMPSHRAGADTLVCAVLFEFLVDYALALDMVTDGPDLGAQIHALCWGPVAIDKWPFGKNKGKLLKDIPTDYYVWALDNMDSLKEGGDRFDPDLAASVARELERRLAE